MIAGGVRHYPPGAFVGVEQAEAVVGPAELEGPAALERLGLEADPGPAGRVQEAGGEQWRAVDDAVEPGHGGADAVVLQGGRDR